MTKPSDNMKVTIHDLDGKYYGTDVTINYKDEDYVFTIWNSKYEPSIRELGSTPREDYEIYDSHYESAITYNFLTELKHRLEEQ